MRCCKAPSIASSGTDPPWPLAHSLRREGAVLQRRSLGRRRLEVAIESLSGPGFAPEPSGRTAARAPTRAIEARRAMTGAGWLLGEASAPGARGVRGVAAAVAVVIA